MYMVSVLNRLDRTQDAGNCKKEKKIVYKSG